MSALLVGYARVSTQDQDLTAQRDALETHLVTLHRAGEHSTAELSDLFGVGRSTVYRVIERDGRRRKQLSSAASGKVIR